MNINRHHNRCDGESGELCFVLPQYYTLSFSFCQYFFENFFHFFCFSKNDEPTTFLSIGKSTKKSLLNIPQILLCMLFHKNFCRFSSQLDIYKSKVLLYNVTCWQTIACQVPLFCTPSFCPCEMPISWHPCASTVMVCNFYLLFIFQISPKSL